MEKVKAIKEKYGEIVFLMGLSYLIDKGCSFCEQLTEPQIKNLRGETWISKEDERNLVRCAVELASLDLLEIIDYWKGEGKKDAE